MLLFRSIPTRLGQIRWPFDAVAFEKCSQLRRWNDGALTDLAGRDIPSRDQLINSRPGKAECIRSVFYAIRQWGNWDRRGARGIQPEGVARLLGHNRIHLIVDGHGH